MTDIDESEKIFNRALLVLNKTIVQIVNSIFLLCPMSYAEIENSQLYTHEKKTTTMIYNKNAFTGMLTRVCRRCWFGMFKILCVKYFN